jgi:hypothetical protein
MAKPLLFGDATLDAARIEEMRAIEGQWDRSYVPGYGEARRKNEWLIRDGKKPIPMDRLQWVRVGHVDGREVGDRDMLDWALNGYQFITKQELTDRGWGMPPTAYVDSQGRIRREDLALAFVDAKQAAKNRERQEAIDAEFMEGRVQSASPENSEIEWESRQDRRASLKDIIEST